MDNLITLPIPMPDMEPAIVVDLFAGGGGASEGIRAALGRDPDIAINHDPEAIAMHAENHPACKHYCQDVWSVSPSWATRGRPVALLWASPDCTHFSKAKGGRPDRDEKRRDLAWVIEKWAREVRPRTICMENVEEFKTWGPLRNGQPIKEAAGTTFRAFVRSLRRLGYSVAWRELRACDYGAPTIRKRFFLVAQHQGSVVWPTPTHGPGCDNPCRIAAECIDWSIVCPSIFERKKPLADATYRRIIDGINRYVLQETPYVAPIQYGEGRSGTGFAFLAKHYTGVVGSDLRRPIGTVTARDHHSLVTAFLIKYYGSGGGASLIRPAPTVTCRDRFGLVTAHLDGETYSLTDIGMRMLQPRELYRAQGFPDSYVIDNAGGKPITKTAQVRMCGNSVCPPVASAVVAANIRGELRSAANG